MGNRLSKIYTRTGDQGETGLGDGSRIQKSHPRMELLGTVDEVNCHIGLLMCDLSENDALMEVLTKIQHDLFNLGGEASVPGYVMVQESDVTFLEDTLDRLNEDLPALKNFILPGGSRAAAQCHLARTVCRRAERVMVILCDSGEAINDNGLKYLNRLSDLLFVMARVLARRDGGAEVLWNQPASE